MKKKFLKFRGEGVSLPTRASWQSIVFAWAGCTIVIALVGLYTQIAETPFILGSFGATSVLIFGFPESPFSQPRNVLVGHTIASLIGLLFLGTFGSVWWAMGLAVGTTTAVMMLTRTVHPPAGSNPIIIFLTQPSWTFLLYPTLTGALILLVAALIYNNSTRKDGYPRYW